MTGIKENMQKGENIWKFSLISQAKELFKMTLYPQKQAASHTIIIYHYSGVANVNSYTF